MMSAWNILVDNPILIRHIRTRLRLSQFLPWVAVVLVLCLSVVWASQAWGFINDGKGLTFLLGLESVILVFIAGAQVGGAVGGVRESGIIDFHRVSPLPPFWMTVGFFLGAPIREYALFAITLPFAIFLGALAPSGIQGWVELTIPIITTAWVFHALAMVSSLISKRPKGSTRGAGIAGVVLAVFFGPSIGSLIWYGISGLQGVDRSISLFGVSFHWLIGLLVYQGTAIGFMFLAATRKFRSERMHAFSKRQAIGAMAAFTVLVLGAVWNFAGQEVIVLVVLYLLVIAAMLLIVTITPTQVEYLRGMRRAIQQGRKRPSPWTDEGSSRPAVCILCAFVLLGGMTSWELVNSDATRSMYSQTIAVAVLTVAYFGFCLLYFLLRLPKSGSTVMAMFLFFVWMLPVLVGSISVGLGTTKNIYTPILCLSPITGIAMSSEMVATSANTQIYKLVALAPAVTFSFIFNYLVESLLRRIDRGVRRTMKPRVEPGPFDYLVAKPAKSDAIEDVDLVVEEPGRFM